MEVKENIIEVNFKSTKNEIKSIDIKKYLNETILFLK